MTSLGELGKDGEDSLEVRVETVAIGTVKRTEPEIVKNRELGENLPTLWNQRDPQPDAVGR
jgi:hypothetical protein